MSPDTDDLASDSPLRSLGLMDDYWELRLELRPFVSQSIFIARFLINFHYDFPHRNISQIKIVETEQFTEDGMKLNRMRNKMYRK